MKNHLHSFSNMKTRDIRKAHFKPIKLSTISNSHRNLLESYGLNLNENARIQQSNLISIKNTGNLKIKTFSQLTLTRTSSLIKFFLQSNMIKLKKQ